jgi:hypothetical protein
MLEEKQVELSKMTLQLLSSGKFPGTHAPLITQVWTYHADRLEKHEHEGKGSDNAEATESK